MRQPPVFGAARRDAGHASGVGVVSAGPPSASNKTARRRKGSIGLVTKSFMPIKAARFPAWLNQIGLSLPKLELLRAEVRSLGGDTWRIRMAVANAGYLPSYVTKRALERKMARGVVFELHPPAGVTLQTGKLRIEGAQLEGHAPASSLQAFLPNRKITADRAVAEWVVIAPRGTRIALTAVADRAGTVRTEVTLD